MFLFFLAVLLTLMNNLLMNNLLLYFICIDCGILTVFAFAFLVFLERYLEKKAKGEIKPRSIQHLPEERRQQLREQWRASKARCRRRQRDPGVPHFMNTVSLPYRTPE